MKQKATFKNLPKTQIRRFRTITLREQQEVEKRTRPAKKKPGDRRGPRRSGS